VETESFSGYVWPQLLGGKRPQEYHHDGPWTEVRVTWPTPSMLDAGHGAKVPHNVIK
jgi:hypothetical protein